MNQPPENRNALSGRGIAGTAICILSLCLPLFHTQVHAQDAFPKSSFGIRAGGNANSWTKEFPSLDYEGQTIYPDDWKATFGFHVGVYANIRVSKLVAIEPALLYTVKGTGTILDAGGTKVEGNVTSNYVDLPFILRLYVADGFNIFLGPQFSYHVGSTFDLKVDNTMAIDGEDVTDTISEFDLAPVLGLGYEFDNGLNLNLSGELGMLSVDGFDYLSTFNRNIRLSLGYSF
jgi:hypothetical protein